MKSYQAVYQILAKEIAESGLSLEEYYGFEGGDYVD